MSYNAFNGGLSPGPCPMTSSNNAQYLMTVNKNTILGTSNLKSLNYDYTTTVSSSALGNALYK